MQQQAPQFRNNQFRNSLGYKKEKKKKPPKSNIKQTPYKQMEKHLSTALFDSSPLRHESSFEAQF